MKKINSVQLLILISIFSVNAFSDESQPTISSKVIRESAVSPEKLENFQNINKGPVIREDNTIKTLYENVDFIRLRSVETAFIVNSGTSEEKAHFSSVKGFSIGGNLEFPVLTNYLNGGTAIAKLRMGKTTIDINNTSDVEEDESLEEFADNLGASELYNIGFGGGYCYHAGFNCVYALYNTSLTGQLTDSDIDNNISAIPTKLNGITLGVSSTFEVGLGLELTAGMEYSLMTHKIPREEDHRFNTLGLVFALGFIEESRYKKSRYIQFVNPEE